VRLILNGNRPAALSGKIAIARSSIAATVACDLAGSTTVGFGDHSIMITAAACRIDEEDSQPVSQGDLTGGQPQWKS
jgi:hypothetical protein